ncbi:hypothetical protein LTR37_011722 [Vermiconidia calcicola]|uniref:Uncharacterized protein n=1 Tax=Vermiconidia calcicola TaxID=1690605 RepID=A0ACC3N450_9PEZI|nr:hypothetical protein LTR37_011722 [Vermiconidia calcicola]
MCMGRMKTKNRSSICNFPKETEQTALEGSEQRAENYSAMTDYAQDDLDTSTISRTLTLSPNLRLLPMRAALHALRQRPYYAFITNVFWCMGGAIFINDNIVEITHINGESMSPTLSPNCKETGRRDVVIWNKWSPIEDLRRGEVVHFMNPLKPEVLTAKRVIALEGDTVLLDRRRRPRVREGPELAAARAWDQWRGKAQIPQGHVWVEGDNWRESLDSNDYGPISKSLITGRAVAVLLPFERFYCTPWVGFRSRTKVVEGRVQSWTEEGLPVELAEIANPHVPP